MKWLIALLAATLIAGYTGFAIGRQPDDVSAYIRRRPWIIEQAAPLRPAGDVLLIGDSIAERSGIESLCGRPVFNAGISGARLEDVDDLGKRLSTELHPSRTVIEIGTNDASKRYMTDPAKWRDRYIALIRALRGVPITLVPAPAIESGKSVSKNIDASHLDRLNAELPAIAKATGAKLLARPVAATTDGVHLSREGAAEWRAALTPACQGT